MADARSKLDILYQDALGDIDAILTRIENVDVGITRQTDEAVERLTMTIGALDKAGQSFRDSSLTYGKQVNGKLTEIYEQTVAVTRTRAEQDANAIVKALLARVEAEVRETVRKEISWPVTETVNEMRSNTWKTMVYCLACGIFGAGITVFTFIYFDDTTTKADMLKYGAAVGKVWQKLPPASQKLIKEAATQE
jgi:hypothetical protein